MKKFLGIFTIAVALVACDNTASSEQRIKDSTDSANRADSLAKTITTPTITTGDTGTNKMSGDTGMNKMSGDTGTSKMSGDTTKKP